MKAKISTLIALIIASLQIEASEGSIQKLQKLKKDALSQSLTCKQYLEHGLLRQVSYYLGQKGKAQFPKSLEKREYLLSIFESKKLSQEAVIVYTKEIFENKNKINLKKNKLTPIQANQTCSIFDEYLFLESFMRSLFVDDWSEGMSLDSHKLIINHLKSQLSYHQSFLSTHVYASLLKEYVDYFQPKLVLEVDKLLFELEIVKKNLESYADFEKDLFYAKEFQTQLLGTIAKIKN